MPADDARHVQARGAMSLDERFEGGQTGRRLHLVAVLRVRGVLAQDSHHLVDLADGLAGDLFDRLERCSRALRVPLGLDAQTVRIVRNPDKLRHL